nr:type IV pilus secretin PilQ [Candidatus Krumholzibacteria bacterium]
MFGRIRFITCAAMLLMLIAGGALAQGEIEVKAADNPVPVPVTPPTRPISLDVQEADINTVLRSLASFSGANMVASPRVEGKVTVKLEEVPWEEALKVILRAHSFDFVVENGVYRIDSAEELRQEKLAVERSRKQVEELEALHLGLVPLSFANAKEVKDALEQMLTDRGNLDVDERTNSLIINDVQARVDLITNMAFDLDSQTPQVEINARLVDMDVKVTRELGINWSLNNFKSPGNNLAGSMTIDNPVQSPAGDLRVATIQDWGDMMMRIQALEDDNKAHLISNPIITTTDNREAKILVGQKIPLIVSDEAGNAVTQLTTIGIMLQVTPHINSEDRITLDIHNEVSDLSSQATVQGGVIINTSESDTRVLVENGETAIIGGLIRKVESNLVNGIPVLKDIPLLGSLFRHTSKTKDSRELVVFVTPRIVTDEYITREMMVPESEVVITPDKLVEF